LRARTITQIFLKRNHAAVAEFFEYVLYRFACHDYSGAADSSALAAPLAFGICMFDIARHDRARVIAFFGRLGNGRQADIIVHYSAPQSRRRLGTGFRGLYQSSLVE
jgi:hypothetical protein